MKPQITISVPPKPPMSYLAEQWADLRASDGFDMIEINAASLRWIKPDSLCLLIELITEASHRAGLVIFICPQNADVHTYLTRADFYAQFPPGVAKSDESVDIRRHDCSSTMLEATRLLDAGAVDRLAPRLYDIARAHIPSAKAATAFTTGVLEASANVIDHARTPTGAVVSAQRYVHGFEMAVVDGGQGIRQSLRENLTYASLTSDERAIDLAVQDGVSRVVEEGHGAGLHNLMQSTKATGTGILRIGSGDAIRTFSYLNGRLVRVTNRLRRRAPGTWIALRLAPSPQ
jgi:anti-sigma regulatory factor (Ser/Thr protein kinase)